MTLDTEPRVATGRSWRDLPPSPPYGDPLAPAEILHEDGTLPPFESGPEPGPERHFSRWLLVATTGVAGLVVILLLWSPWSDSDAQSLTQPVSTTISVPTTLPLSPSPSPSNPSTDEPVADVAEALLPSVVQIERAGGVGSGFVFDESGRIFTAAHVVRGVSTVTVRLYDGRSVDGTVLAVDDAHDVAVVGIDAPGLVAAPLGAADGVVVGQLAVAIGSPFGLDQTVTAGVVSGLNQRLTINGRTLSGLIQTDAPINSGNSGGPLADRTGRVIGINVAIVSGSGGSDGLGFAVPIDVARALAATADQGGSTQGDASASNDLLDQLQDLADQFGMDPFGFFPFDGPAVPGTTSFIAPTVVPQGYRVGGIEVWTSGATTTQTVSLQGPRGEISIAATRGQDATVSQEGESLTVRGRAATIIETATSRLLSWQEQDGTALQITAPGSLGRDELIALAEGLEVSP